MCIRDSGETVEGGSTITQQLVKNLFLSSKRTMSRKAEEAILAVEMEHYYSKDEILTMYLNTVYYGPVSYTHLQVKMVLQEIRNLELNLKSYVIEE